MSGIQIICSEQDIEDILEEHCGHYLGLRFITRQFRTPVGIIDIIAKHPAVENSYFVIELKRHTLDASAYLQTIRYARWMNSEMSKNGKRFFTPMIIGQSLHPDLSHICDYFEIDDYPDVPTMHRLRYRLFNFDPLKGFCFDWHSTEQETASNAFLEQFCHLRNIQERLEAYELDEYMRLREVVG